jgi:hypothetical protein
MRHLTALSFVALTFAFASSAKASATYIVTVDTSSILGTAGSLDFNFDPGPNTAQDASLQILDFTTDGTPAGSPELTGDVNGTLPGAITFDNQTAFNDYFEDFTFGTTVTFEVYLYGPALDSPDGVSTSGSVFAFSMFSDAAGTAPVLTSDTTYGTAFTIDVNLDGTTSVTNNSPETSIAAVPEPGSFALVSAAIVMYTVHRLRRRSRNRRDGRCRRSFRSTCTTGGCCIRKLRPSMAA